MYLVKAVHLKLCYFILSYFIESENGVEGQRERERESQVVSTLSVKPDAGLDLKTLGS